MIDQERKTRLLRKVVELSGVSLTDQDRDVLERVLTMEPVLKGLASLYDEARGIWPQLADVPFHTTEGQHLGTKMQGVAAGYFRAIEGLFKLVTLPEEQDHGTSEHAAE